MVKSIEAVVVGDGDICPGLQQHGQDVVTLLADGVVEGSVAFRVLGQRQLTSVLTPTHIREEDASVPLGKLTRAQSSSSDLSVALLQSPEQAPFRSCSGFSSP